MKVFGKGFTGGWIVQDLGNGKVEWNIDKVHMGWIVRGFVEGKPGRIEVFRMKTPHRVLAGGWQSWSPFRVFKTDGYEFSYQRSWMYKDTPRPELGNILSDYFFATDNLVVGFLSSKTAHGYFTLEGDEIVGWLDYFDAHFPNRIQIEPFVILEGKDTSVLLEIYASMVARESGARFSRRSPIGWCSWYHYFLDLKWEDILKNLELSKNFPIEVFQIDDAYELDIGDWLETKEGFPPVEEMANAISSHGLVAGIWTAPFSISETSRLFKEHPDWVVKENGNPKVAYRNWGRSIYALDLSNDEALEWLFETFKKLRDYGYRYFKIDFLFSGAIPGERKKNMTPVQAFRAGMRTIRNAVEDSFVLGCGSPLLPSIGYVDGMRIGEDTAPYWSKGKDDGRPSARYALRNTITRYFMHNKWWLNDPDCLLLRGKKTKLTSDQRELYAYTVGILDNMVLMSDDLELVDEDGKRILEETLRLRGGKPRVEGLMEPDEKYVVKSDGTLSGNTRIEVDLSKGKYEMTVEEYSYLKKEKVFKDGRIFNFYEEE